MRLPAHRGNFIRCRVLAPSVVIAAQVAPSTWVR
jgi:hypothetical protein